MSDLRETELSASSRSDVFDKKDLIADKPKEQSPEPTSARPVSSSSFDIRRIGKRFFKPAKPAFTVGLLVAFLAIIAITVYLIMTMGTHLITDPIYRFNSGIETTYEGETRVFRAEDGDIVTFSMQNDGQTIELTEPRTLATSPLYWQEEERMFLPAMMSITQPSLGIEAVRTGYYTEISRDGEGFIARIDNRDVRLENGFLFDGQSVYVFLEDVTVDYLGTRVEMPAMSYAVVVPGLRVELYPYGKEPIVEQTGLIPISADGENFFIDMTNDVLQANGEQMLLFTTPSILDVIAP